MSEDLRRIADYLEILADEANKRMMSSRALSDLMCRRDRILEQHKRDEHSRMVEKFGIEREAMEKAERMGTPYHPF